MEQGAMWETLWLAGFERRSWLAQEHHGKHFHRGKRNDVRAGSPQSASIPMPSIVLVPVPTLDVAADLIVWQPIPPPHRPEAEENYMPPPHALRRL